MIVDRLRGHEVELRSLGVDHLALFGSMARGEAHAGSDVDLAARLDRSRGIDLFAFVALRDRLAEVVGTPVDLVSEPTRKPRMQAAIDRDRFVVF